MILRKDSYLFHLSQHIVFHLFLGDGPKKEAAVVQARTHTDELSRTYFVVVQHLDGPLCCLPSQNTFGCKSTPIKKKKSHLSGTLLVGIHDKGITTVFSSELHHQSQLVQLACSFKKRDELIFIHVSGNLPHKNLAASWWRWALPVCTFNKSTSGTNSKLSIVQFSSMLQPTNPIPCL